MSIENVNVRYVSTCLETEKTQVSHVVLGLKTKYNDQKLLDSLEEDAGIVVPFLFCKEGGGGTLRRIDLCPLQMVYVSKLEKKHTSATDCSFARNQLQL